jgi:Zinc carboxypeptidase
MAMEISIIYSRKRRSVRVKIEGSPDPVLYSDCKLDGVKSVDWYVAPLLNPDGYEYSFTTDRLWRKNRWKPILSIRLNYDQRCETATFSTAPGRNLMHN